MLTNLLLCGLTAVTALTATTTKPTYEVPQEWEQYNINEFYVEDGKFTNIGTWEQGVFNINGKTDETYSTNLMTGLNYQYLAFKIEGDFSPNLANIGPEIQLCDSKKCFYYKEIKNNEWNYFEIDITQIKNYYIYFQLRDGIEFKNCKFYFMLGKQSFENVTYIPNLKYMAEIVGQQAYQEGYKAGYEQGKIDGFNQATIQGNTETQLGLFYNATWQGFNVTNDEYTSIEQLNPYAINAGVDITKIYSEILSELSLPYSTEIILRIYLDKPVTLDKKLIIRSTRFNNISLYDNGRLTTEFTSNDFQGTDRLYTLEVSEGTTIDMISINIQDIKSEILTIGTPAYYNEAYVQGQLNGFNTGFNDGYNKGFIEGEKKGYDKGFSAGITEGSSGHYTPFGWLASLSAFVGSVLSIQLLPGMTIGGLVFIPLMFAIVALLLGFFKGGGK